MLKITPLNGKTRKDFGRLFADYYAELDCGEDVPHLLKEYILPDCLAGIIKIDILKDGDTYAGFIIYQKDDIDNEWNLKEDWGDVRELYVIPSLRRRGLGRALLSSAETKLKESGAAQCYCLPAEGTEGFFAACGYSRGNEYNEELDTFVYEKTDLNNR